MTDNDAALAAALAQAGHPEIADALRQKVEVEASVGDHGAAEKPAAEEVQEAALSEAEAVAAALGQLNADRRWVSIRA